MALKKNPKYDLKSKYTRFFQISIIFSLLIIIAAFKFSPHQGNPEKFENITQDLAIIKEYIPPTTEKKVPPKPQIPVEATTEKDLEDINIPDTEVDINENIAPTEKMPVEDDNSDYEAAPFIAIPDKLPQPIGGISAINKNINYPPMAIRAEIQGRVLVVAFIDENGNVTKTELLKGIGAGCDEEAMLAVSKTKFYPGQQRGRAVKTKVTVPVLFKLR